MATKDEVIRQNKELLAKYPWLTPSNRWSGKWITDCMGDDGEEGYWPGEPLRHPDYDYTYTEKWYKIIIFDFHQSKELRTK